MKFLIGFLLILPFGTLRGQEKVFFGTRKMQTDSASSLFYIIRTRNDVSGSSKLAFYTSTGSIFYNEVKRTGSDIFDRTYYYPNGKAKSTAGFYGYDPVGNVKSYYEDGSPQGEFEFERTDPSKDKQPLIGIINYYDKDGKAMVENGSGYCHCNLAPFEEEMIENGLVEKGLRTGEWTGENTTLNFKFRENYKDGELTDGVMNSEGKDYKYKRIEEPPTYPGGMIGLMKYISSNMKYPKSASRMGLEGTVYVSFVINPDGHVVDSQIVKGIGRDCDAEALRVVSKISGWSPGKQRGKPVKVRFALPLKFRLT